MTRPTLSPFRTPDAPQPPAVRYRWRDPGEAAVWFLGLVLVTWASLATAYVIAGAIPACVRWFQVNAVATVLWCLAFVRREVAP